MMRSLYSGVSGLKVHQTKMDVIGNNIANVNTVGFKSSTVNFSDVLYQTTKSASGANEATGKAGTNAVQIGLGSKLASITSSVTVTGGSQRTDNPFDLMINGDAFFVVNQGGQNYFTKAGAFKVDANGTLCTSTGAYVMGWQVDSTGTNIVKDIVSPLNIMSPENLYAAPEATTELYISGNIDEKDPQLATEAGYPLSMNFYDKVGNSYNIKLTFKESGTPGVFNISVADVVDSNNQSIFAQVDKANSTNGETKYMATDITSLSFGGVDFDFEVDPDTGEVTMTTANASVPISFNTKTGKFSQIGTEADATSISLTIDGTDNVFETMNVDFSSITKYSTSDKCSLEPHKGNKEGIGKGRKVGEMSGLSIDDQGMIYGTYNNGTVKLLGQIAVATFANPAGLEAIGNSMFRETANSGEFNGIGQDPTEGGGSLTPGVLEMSNVDLSEEFTSMITTQRGFQANSRIITTSDTLLEELINLKR